MQIGFLANLAVWAEIDWESLLVFGAVLLSGQLSTTKGHKNDKMTE